MRTELKLIHKVLSTPKKYSLETINLLDFVIKTINYTAITTLLQSTLISCGGQFPMQINWTNNKSVQVWLRKVATRIDKGKALQRFLSRMMINNRLTIKAYYIEGH